MVSAISKGRFGNFAFTNMAAYVYSLKHGLDFHIQDRSLAPHLWPLYFQHLKNPNWDANKETVYVNDGKHSYTELPFKEEWRDKNIIIGTEDINTGYLQSFKYLKGYEKQVRETFFSPQYFDILSMSRYWWFDQKGASLHVRLGDYLTLPDHHPVITMDYILRAVVECIKIGVERITVFSDDIEWCKNNIPQEVKKFSDIDILFKENGDEIWDFFDMMNKPVNIISNSSYSLLASILNPNLNKVVISPHEDNWYGVKNKHLSVETMIPKEYIRIKY